MAEVKVYVPVRQRLRVREAAEFGRVGAIRQHRIFDEHIAADPAKYLIAGAYQGEIPRMIRSGMLPDGLVVWSLWNGYLAEKSGVRLQEVLANHGIPLVGATPPGTPTSPI